MNFNGYSILSSLHPKTFNVCLMFLSFLGDGMNAYVAYKVSTRVCKKA